MPWRGPIVVIDDDVEDQDIIQTVFSQIGVSNKIIFFNGGEEAIQYFSSTTDTPFLIFSDINMPGMNGIELRKKLVESKFLLKKSTPFIFLTTSPRIEEINLAYGMLTQGFFKKADNEPDFKAQLKKIIDYWMDCLHPNNSGKWQYNS